MWCIDLWNRGYITNNACFWAITAGAIDAISLLKEWKAHIYLRLDFIEDQFDRVLPVTRETILHEAAERNSIKILELVKDWNIDWYVRDSEGQTALHRAIKANAVDTIKYIKAHCSDFKRLAAIVDNDGKNALTYVLANNGIATLEALADQCDISIRDMNERTLLHLAIIARMPWNAIVACNWATHDMATARDKEGKTPLHWAAELNSRDLHQMLKSPCYNLAMNNANNFFGWFIRGDEPRCYCQDADKNGNTPLHWMAKHGMLSILESLYDKKSKAFIKNLRNKAGESPIDWAKKYATEQTSDYLLEKIRSYSSVSDPEIDAMMARQKELSERLGRGLTAAEMAYCNDRYRW